MVNLEKSINALLAERALLVNQLNAVDEALAALRGATEPAAPPADIARAEPAGPEVTRVAPKRVLSEEHKQKLAEGRQRTRRNKEVAKGTAREPLDGVPALAAALSEAPRLVKRSASQAELRSRRHRRG
jgi:hypothetical protein